MVNDEGNSLITYNTATESIVIHDICPTFPLEFSKNQLLVSISSHMYLVNYWTNVRFIEESNCVNDYKTFAFTMPCFDERSFPFIILVCRQNISILNVNTLVHKPIAIGLTNSGIQGLQFAFVMGDMSVMYLHLALTI